MTMTDENEVHHHTSADCPVCCLPCSIQTTFLCMLACVPFLVLSLTEPWDNLVLNQENSTDVVLLEDYLIDYYEYYTDADCPWFWNATFWFIGFFYPNLKFFIQCVCLYTMFRVTPSAEGEESYWKEKLIDSVHFNVFHLGSLVFKFTQAMSYIGAFLFLVFTVGYHTDNHPPLSFPLKPGFTYYISASQTCLTLVDYFIFLLDLKHAPNNFPPETNQQPTNDIRSPLLSGEGSESNNTSEQQPLATAENKANPSDSAATSQSQSSMVKDDQTTNSRSDDESNTETEAVINVNSNYPFMNEIEKDPLILIGGCAVLGFILLMFAPLMNITYKGSAARHLSNIDEDFTLNQILKRFRDLFKFVDSDTSANIAYAFFLIESVITPAFLLWMATWSHYLLMQGKEKETAILYFWIEYTYPFMSIESFAIGLLHFAGTAEPLADYYFNLPEICQNLDENYGEGCLTIEYKSLWGTWILFLFLLTLLPYLWIMNIRLRRIHTPHAENKSKVLLSS